MFFVILGGWFVLFVIALFLFALVVGECFWSFLVLQSYSKTGLKKKATIKIKVGFSAFECEQICFVSIHSMLPQFIGVFEACRTDSAFESVLRINVVI